MYAPLLERTIVDQMVLVKGQRVWNSHVVGRGAWGASMHMCCEATRRELERYLRARDAVWPMALEHDAQPPRNEETPEKRTVDSRRCLLQPRPPFDSPRPMTIGTLAR